jgi:hypothetical protein
MNFQIGDYVTYPNTKHVFQIKDTDFADTFTIKNIKTSAELNVNVFDKKLKHITDDHAISIGLGG